ncbi:MAG: hypothetical protein ACHP7P_09850, partial [Terriglobales bacterium]
RAIIYLTDCGSRATFLHMDAVTPSELLIRLLDAFEIVYAQNLCYKTLLKKFASRLPPQREIEQVLEAATASTRDMIAKDYAPLRARIRQAQSLEEALQEFLRVVPARKDVN